MSEIDIHDILTLFPFTDYYNLLIDCHTNFAFLVSLLEACRCTAEEGDKQGIYSLTSLVIHTKWNSSIIRTLAHLEVKHFGATRNTVFRDDNSPATQYLEQLVKNFTTHFLRKIEDIMAQCLQDDVLIIKQEDSPRESNSATYDSLAPSAEYQQKIEHYIEQLIFVLFEDPLPRQLLSSFLAVTSVLTEYFNKENNNHGFEKAFEFVFSSIFCLRFVCPLLVQLGVKFNNTSTAALLSKLMLAISTQKTYSEYSSLGWANSFLPRIQDAFQKKVAGSMQATDGISICPYYIFEDWSKVHELIQRKKAKTLEITRGMVTTKQYKRMKSALAKADVAITSYKRAGKKHKTKAVVGRRNSLPSFMSFSVPQTVKRKGSYSLSPRFSSSSLLNSSTSNVVRPKSTLSPRNINSNSSSSSPPPVTKASSASPTTKKLYVNTSLITSAPERSTSLSPTSINVRRSMTHTRRGSLSPTKSTTERELTTAQKQAKNVRTNSILDIVMQRNARYNNSAKHKRKRRYSTNGAPTKPTTANVENSVNTNNSSRGECTATTPQDISPTRKTLTNTYECSNQSNSTSTGSKIVFG